ncbi:MAG TPA: DUF2914 domain-containing protein [Sandaracinaceae bacterium LLY-WYZ-13_1]|nr:DUF2914 domain-containing protein [Sandaracinaceae bacterium LLY-WYZ-13_1]
MKTNVKLVAGGVAAMLLPVAAGIAFFLWADGAAAPTEAARPDDAETSEPPASPEDADAPVPSPELEPALARTHRSSARPAPRPEAREPELPQADREDAPEPHEPELRADGPVRVRRLIVATGVRAHEPTGAADTFELHAQAQLYAFVDAANATDEDTALEVTFEPPHGEATGHVSLDVPAGAPRWRTWAYTRHVYEPGRWHAVVRGADGRVLARRAFDVEAR